MSEVRRSEAELVLGGDTDDYGLNLGEAKFEMPEGDVQSTGNYRGLGSPGSQMGCGVGKPSRQRLPGVM